MYIAWARLHLHFDRFRSYVWKINMRDAHYYLQYLDIDISDLSDYIPTKTIVVQVFYKLLVYA